GMQDGLLGCAVDRACDDACDMCAVTVAICGQAAIIQAIVPFADAPFEFAMRRTYAGIDDVGVNIVARDAELITLVQRLVALIDAIQPPARLRLYRATLNADDGVRFDEVHTPVARQFSGLLRAH